MVTCSKLASEVMRRIGVETHLSANTHIGNALNHMAKMIGMREFATANTLMSEATKVLFDSGANVCVTNYALGD